MKLFATDLFYRDPILLEDVDDGKFREVSICPRNKTVEYIVPTDQYMYRSPQSANTVGVNLSSLCSRVHVLARGCHPKQATPIFARQLAQQYIELGFDKTIVIKTINQILRVYRSQA